MLAVLPVSPHHFASSPSHYDSRLKEEMALEATEKPSQNTDQSLAEQAQALKQLCLDTIQTKFTDVKARGELSRQVNAISLKNLPTAIECFQAKLEFINTKAKDERSLINKPITVLEI